MAKKVTIDGHSACGKTFISNMIVTEFGFSHVDSGLIFRLVSYLKSKNGYDIKNLIDEIDYFTYFDLNGKLIDNLGFESSTLKTEEVGLIASQIGKDKKVQLQLIELQRKVVKRINSGYQFRGIVLSGRNCGSAVLPNADLKFFLTAPLEVRVERRYKELSEMRIPTSKDKILEKITIRDEQDANRQFGQLKIPNDAILIDTSKYNKNELSQNVKNQILTCLEF